MFHTRGLPTGSRWVQSAVTRAYFAIRSIGTVVDRQRLIRPQPHSHALKSTSCSIVGLSQAIFRSFGPLSCTYVISFPGPHSELPVSSVSPVHRDRHSIPARAPVYAPAHLPSHAASPIMQTPARSESTSLSAPRGGRCRLLMRSAGFPRQQTCDHRLGCGWYPYRRETLLRGDARLFRDAKCGVAPV